MPNSCIIYRAIPCIERKASQVIQFLLRSDSEAEAPAENLVKFDRQVTHEDMAILEACDHDVPLSPGARREFLANLNEPPRFRLRVPRP